MTPEEEERQRRAWPFALREDPGTEEADTAAQPPQQGTARPMETAGEPKGPASPAFQPRPHTAQPRPTPPAPKPQASEADRTFADLVDEQRRQLAALREPTAAELERRRRKLARDAALGSVADGVAALSSLWAATKGAPTAWDPSQSWNEATRRRYEQAKALDDENARRRLAAKERLHGLYQAREASQAAAQAAARDEQRKDSELEMKYQELTLKAQEAADNHQYKQADTYYKQAQAMREQVGAQTDVARANAYAANQYAGAAEHQAGAAKKQSDTALNYRKMAEPTKIEKEQFQAVGQRLFNQMPASSRSRMLRLFGGALPTAGKPVNVGTAYNPVYRQQFDYTAAFGALPDTDPYKRRYFEEIGKVEKTGKKTTILQVNAKGDVIGAHDYDTFQPVDFTPPQPKPAPEKKKWNAFSNLK